MSGSDVLSGLSRDVYVDRGNFKTVNNKGILVCLRSLVILTMKRFIMQSLERVTL